MKSKLSTLVLAGLLAAPILRADAAAGTDPKDVSSPEITPPQQDNGIPVSQEFTMEGGWSGRAQVKQGKDAEAEATFVKAVALRAAFHDDQAWGEAEGHLAFAASKNHDPQTSLAALDARSTVLPNSPTSLFLQATAHDTLHQNKEAITAYRAFLAIAGDKFPDQTFEAQHRIIALQRVR